jgi:hypothetical protein
VDANGHMWILFPLMWSAFAVSEESIHESKKGRTLTIACPSRATDPHLKLPRDLVASFFLFTFLLCSIPWILVWHPGPGYASQHSQTRPSSVWLVARPWLVVELGGGLSQSGFRPFSREALTAGVKANRNVVAKVRRTGMMAS